MNGVTWLTPHEVAEVLEVSLGDVDRLVHSHQLECRRVGANGYYVSQRMLEDYILRSEAP